MSYLGDLLAERRDKLGLKTEEVVRKAGLVKTQDALDTYDQIEAGYCAFPDQSMLDRFSKALGLKKGNVMFALLKDFREWDEPVPLHFLVANEPGHYSAIPTTVDTRMEAERVGADLARKLERPVCLVLSMIRGVFILPDGEMFEAYGLPCGLVGEPDGFRGLCSVIQTANLMCIKGGVSH